MLKYLHQNVLKNYKVSILNGATANGNKTIQELKAETLENKNIDLKKQIEKLQVEKRDLKREVAKWKKKREAKVCVNA